ncbi:hemolysin family protein [Brachybacterium sp. J153]|uniref:hemolysin family protein n=1 Tax=Brachybacterium sp. J153 TaxID=3116488 RepID=UPI002E79FBCE|nr:hemolysin family protein [Brachybacterium sp. J153]MEE1617281.1 hemolysin family protein [Brachybacterium sp. J153]
MTAAVALLILIPLAAAALVLAAVLTAVDAAHLSVSRSALERDSAELPEAVRARVLDQHTDSARTLAAVSLGRTLAEAVGLIAITAASFLGLGATGVEGWVLPALLALAISALLLLIIAAASPRTIGRRRAESVLLSTHLLVQIVRGVLWFPAGLLVSVGAGVAARPHGGEGPEDPARTARRGVDRALEDEHVGDGERDMIQGVFELRGTMVRELMVPRPDMITVAATATATEAMRLFVRSGFSRIPVIGEDVDDLRGMLYVKDVMRAVHAPWDPRPDRPVTEIMRRARFVPEFVPADEVLRQMQTSRVHIVVLVDEYGGVSGIVTIEDVLEEIVGEIADEHDPVAPEVEDLGDGRFRVPTRASLDELGELFGLDLDDADIDSVGGLLGKVTGRVPIVGTRAVVFGLALEGERTAGRRKRLSTVIARRAEEDEVAPSAASPAEPPAAETDPQTPSSELAVSPDERPDPHPHPAAAGDAAHQESPHER